MLYTSRSVRGDYLENLEPPIHARRFAWKMSSEPRNQDRRRTERLRAEHNAARVLRRRDIS